MEQIIISQKDINLLEENYPDLKYDRSQNKITGILSFCRSYHERKICGEYSIEFNLENGGNSILPKVKETEGKILRIAKQKKISPADVHLNSTDGELCIIIPIKESEHYPSGFELRRFLNHLEEHFYWITYYERYNKKP